MPIDPSWYVRPPGVPERLAAGGVVVRAEGERVYTVLTRDVGRPSYILPKGGIDPGETPEQAARREIAEEAGIVRLTLLDFLGTRGRLNFRRKRWTTTHYFLFHTDQTEFIRTERGRYKPAWFPLDDLPSLFWPEQRELIESNRNRMIQLATQH